MKLQSITSNYKNYLLKIKQFVQKLIVYTFAIHIFISQSDSRFM